MAAIAGGILGAPLAAWAQPVKKPWRIGYLSGGSSPVMAPYVAAFHEGLRNRGLIEVENIVVEYRWADGNTEKLHSPRRRGSWSQPDRRLRCERCGGERARREPRSLAPMRAVWAFVAAALVLGSCARQDWIDRTLLTETVAGAWEGTMTTATMSPSATNQVRFAPEQEGPKVKGSFAGALYSTAPLGTLLIEGSMAGDVFTFQDARGMLTGELTVSGDEMTGKGVVGNNRQVVIRLRRVDAVAPTSSPPR